MTEDEFQTLASVHGLAPSRTLQEYVEDVIKTETHPNTHGVGCWSWGPRHYLCAYKEIERLQKEIDNGAKA